MFNFFSQLFGCISFFAFAIFLQNPGGCYLKGQKFSRTEIFTEQIFAVGRSKNCELCGINFRDWVIYCEFRGIYYCDWQIKKVTDEIILIQGIFCSTKSNLQIHQIHCEWVRQFPQFPNHRPTLHRHLEWLRKNLSDRDLFLILTDQ